MLVIGRGARNAANNPYALLIVDDNEINRRVAQSMLESLGYESEASCDGDEALAAIARSRFDLVLMDCHMPVRNGYDTAREIRSREEQSSQSQRLPIVALTADFLQSNRQMCLDAGMDDYVTKPFASRHLRVVLERWLTQVDPREASPVGVDSDGFSELGDTAAFASIDHEAFAEIRRLDSSPGATVLREIVVSYCASSTMLMLQLRSAVAEHDRELVEQLAHSLKGGSAQLGASSLATLCDDMIFSTRQDDLEGLVTQLERAAIEHCAVLSDLERELQNTPA